MVDPDQVRAGKGNGITAPDVLRVEFGDVNVLHDDVFDAGEAEAFSTNYALGAFADDGFVGLDVNGFDGGVIVGDGDFRIVGFGAL